ncbi:MAG TPA: thioesterase, partial [Syntrophales bacterium]|nr:thioesterase [Syntrophales bacterium]
MGEENEKRSADEKGEADVAGKIWTEGHKVRSYEADPHGNITVLSLYNYLQEAAANHARALGVSIHEIIS